MKRFRFRLERLLALREQAERLQAAALGTAMRDEQREREALARARETETRAAEQAAEMSAAGTTTAGARAHLDLVRQAAERVAESAEEEVASASARTDVEREAFGETRKERRTVERLKEKRQGTWIDDLGREERKDMDDVAQRLRTPKGGR